MGVRSIPLLSRRGGGNTKKKGGKGRGGPDLLKEAMAAQSAGREGGSGKARGGGGGGGKTQKKKPARPKKPDVSYRIAPANYLILSESEKDGMLRQFIRVVGSLEEGRRLRITAVNRKAVAECAGRTYDYVEEAVYFTSKQDLGPALSSAGFRSARMDEPLRFVADAEKAGHMTLPDGALARAYVVYDFPRSITPAWFHQIAQVATVAEADIAQLRPAAARRALITHANTFEAMGGRRLAEEAQDARSVNDMLQRQETRVYECAIRAVVTGTDRADLARNCKEFSRQCAQRSIRAMSVPGKNGEIAVNGWGPRFLFEGASCAAFYPFVSSTLLEIDGAGGVYLGANEFDGTPVVYDYLRRTNYNMTVLGSSGSGKSVSAKTYLDNFGAMMRDKYGADAPAKMYILDLHGEYVALKDYLGMDVVDLMSRDEMGLDPFSLLPTSDAAVDMLADVSEMPPALRSLALSKAEGCSTVVELVGRLRAEKGRDADRCGEAAAHLAMFAEGKLSGMFKGELKIRDRTILSLRKASESNINSMLISLALQKIWLDVRDAPAHVPKVLVIEEAWFALRMESTAAILSNIARSGRKENCHLIVMTQDIDEVLQSEHGAAVIKNSATVMLHALKPATASTLQRVLDLSDKERDEIAALDKGQAIMRADRNRIKLQVMPTPEQLARFNTAATGLTAAAAAATASPQARSMRDP